MKIYKIFATAGIVVTMGIALAASFGTGGAQNSPGSAAIDASLRGDAGFDVV